MNKIKIAIQFLKENQSFTIDDLRLDMNNEILNVTGWSQYKEFNNLKRGRCLEELEEIKRLFSQMLFYSKELELFVSGKTIEYSLDFDDYGKTSIGICSEKNGVVIWRVQIK